ncbi:MULTISPECIES: hypothetical protein [unclassified Neptuniibacter]|uniref:hypothetical protein n=1 Tax=unclassified Neptuniibacter TaxID=2630693 RepID=UPI000C4C4292|nr:MULTISPECIES: hypothetical protein [unclassified Neptuniibacter]MAY41696.1 hypothetical protein [Oceanospirillaceae bacterium]|tara:strand:- start:4567 stop:4758 length:192 start_codon:yes stop_codon:yes gene_type:complete
MSSELGNKTGDCSKEHLLNCLAREMLSSWTLEQRRNYLKKLPDTAQEEMKQRLLKAHKAKQAA